MDSESICMSWHDLLYFWLQNTSVLYSKEPVTLPAVVIGVRKNSVLWNLTLCCWVSGPRHPFDTLEPTYPVTHHHIPEDWNPPYIQTVLHMTQIFYSNCFVCL